NKIAFKSSKVYASDVAVKTNADETTLYQCYLSADTGVVANADGVVVQDTNISAITLGASVCGEYCTVRSCLVELASDGVGIEVVKGSENSLVTLNEVRGAQKSISVNGAFNAVVLLNSAIRVFGSDNVNLYVVENKLGGAIKLENNKYLLCDGNTFNKDGKDHPVENTGNTEINGDNLHDVDARVEYGANEEILPHTNKDLFIDMERLSFVNDISQTKSYGVNNYIRYIAKTEPFVILPPGAYTTDAKIYLDKSHSNTTIYGYGAYIERNGRDLKVTNGVVSQEGIVLQVYGSSNIVYKGVTVGYNFPSAGQLHVVDKLDDFQLLVIPGAGFDPGFAKIDPSNYSTSTTWYPAGSLRPWHNISAYEFVKDSDGNVIVNDDGTMILKFTSLSGKTGNQVFSTISKGDVVACRLSGDNSSTVSIGGESNGVLLKDCVIYGYSSALSIVGSGRSKGLALERVHNTAHSQHIIDKETYELYAAIEETYGVDLEISIDSEGRYRGAIPRTGSVDATHITGTAEGLSATSCIFDQMCDDGSNQRGSSSRLAGYKVNDDGTTTIYYKGTISETYWNLNTNALKTSSTPTNTTAILAGDKVYAYASNGHVLFDTVALTKGTTVTSSPLYHVCHVDKLDNSTIKEGDITEINGIYDSFPMCVDGLCDVCGNVTHYDVSKNGKCDVCMEPVHTDIDRNGVCDIAGCTYNDKSVGLKDENGDGLNDDDNVPIITDRFYISKFNATGGNYNVSSLYTKGSNWYNITYNSYIWEFTVKTDDVNFEAFEGYDLTDNEYRMDDKILLDNLSANSVGFTFDNVLIKDKTSRGILCKTHDVTIKNCTFRGFSSTGVLLSVETTWGESTVPRNVVVESCLFDDTGRLFGTDTNLTYACIAIQGLGANKATELAISEDTLPCRNIKVIGNKFMNVNNYYAISVSAAQDIVIKDNVFEGRAYDTAKQFTRAININGAMNIEISGNTYSKMMQDNFTKAVIALNYKNLTGSDVEGILPTDKDPVVAE
ncbi:MAG: hypothetical protein J6L83_03535, partial [Clostridia bacterium]|nr:hypothetical protein [Clostridia bacterium]